MTDDKEPTHTGFAKKRIGKRHFVWLEIGKGRLDSDGAFHGLLNRVPIGGFDGYVYFAPTGMTPPEPEPGRPGQIPDGEPT